MIGTPREVTPEEALERLAPVTALIYRALEYGTEQAREFFENGRPVDPHLFSGLVRYHSREFLRREEHAAIGFSLENLSNIGLKVNYARFILRLWKATDDGLLPPPGLSATRADFYNQPLPLFDSNDELLLVTRLAILWDVNSALSLSEVTLVCPSESVEAWKPGHSHWEIPIPHPAEAIQPHESLTTPSEDLEEDLDLVALPTASDQDLDG
jgi:hypothetical protein